MGVCGEMLVDIEIGSKKIPHNVFVAYIIHSVIRRMDSGMDLMKHHRVVIIVPQKSVKKCTEELICNS